MIPIISLIAALGALAAATLLIPRRAPHRAPDPALIHPAENKDDTAMDESVWPKGWPHEAPDRPLTVVDAHLTMQRHRGCLRNECPRKAAAYTALVKAGHIVPDTARAR